MKREIIIKPIKSMSDKPLHPGDLLKEFGMKNDLKQAQIAELCEFHPSNFGHYISQYRKWPARLFLTAGALLNEDPEDLMVLEFRFKKWERTTKAAKKLRDFNDNKKPKED